MATLTVQADIDASMEQAQPDHNYGFQEGVGHRLQYAGEAKVSWRRAIGNFDVSALAGATINSAKLVREVSNIVNPGVEAKLSRCTRPSTWTEGGVTWNKWDGTTDWTTAGGDFDDPGPPGAITYTEPSSTGEHEILGLKAFVEDALDNRGGIVSIITRLWDEDPEVHTEYSWRSKEYGSNIWRLVVDYTPAGPAGGLPERGELRGVLRGVVRGY